MLPESDEKANLYIRVGILLGIISFISDNLLPVLILIGSILIIIGGVYYSKSKDYKGFIGIILVLIGIIALLFSFFGFFVAQLMAS